MSNSFAREEARFFICLRLRLRLEGIILIAEILCKLAWPGFGEKKSRRRRGRKCQFIVLWWRGLKLPRNKITGIRNSEPSKQAKPKSGDRSLVNNPIAMRSHVCQSSNNGDIPSERQSIWLPRVLGQIIQPQSSSVGVTHVFLGCRHRQMVV